MLLFQNWRQSCFGQQREVIVSVAGILAAYIVTMMGLLAWFDATVTKISTRAASDGAHMNWRTLWKSPSVMLLAQFGYKFGHFRALSARVVEWRHVRYEILDQSRVRRLEDDSTPKPAPLALSEAVDASLRRHI